MVRKKIKTVVSNDTEDNYEELEENDNNEIENNNDDDEDEFNDDNELESDIGIIDDDNIVDEDILDYDEMTYESKPIIKDYITGEQRISSNRLTKYEMVRILGERTKQLTMGAKPLIKNYHTLSYDKISEEEFKLNMIPFKIIRTLPNGTQELWYLDELYKEHLYSQL